MFRLVHKFLCLVGVHADEKIFSWSAFDNDGSTDYNNPDGEFQCVGSLCVVCHRERRKDNA